MADLPTATFGTWTGVKPLVVYFTADSGNVVGPLTWTRWDQRSAVGEGTWNYDDCQPSCAEGKVTHYSATITLSRPSHGQFTLVTEVQTGPHGTTQTWRLPNGGLWARSTLS